LDGWPLCGVGGWADPRARTCPACPGNENDTGTDGAKYVADAAGAYWLLDEIALAQRVKPQVAAEEFQVWKLTVNEKDSATLVCEGVNDNVVSTEAIPSDFPHESVTLWFADNMIYLPSEH
jgi:hypothetical protein